MKKKKVKQDISVIAASVRKISLVLFVALMALATRQIQGTNAFFFDTATLDSDSVTAGYWEEPEVEVTSPDSEDIWQVGSTRNITWTAESADPSATDSMDISISYACDGGSWNTIDSDTENDGSYSWTVPEDISDECEIMVEAEDSHGLIGGDESEEFEISYMIALNEFVPRPPSGDTEMVEIYNYGTVPVNLSGWVITDNSGPSSHRRLIDSAHTDTGSTIIDPSSSRFLVVRYDGEGFYLNNTGDDEVRLYDDSNILIDHHDYSDPPEGKSYARIPDGVGAWINPVPTPGKKNTKSNDEDDFRKYYEKVCFKDDEPICDTKFLKSLGLIEEKKKEEKKPEEKKESPPGDKTDQEVKQPEEIITGTEKGELEEETDLPKNETEEEIEKEKEKADLPKKEEEDAPEDNVVE